MKRGVFLGGFFVLGEGEVGVLPYSGVAVAFEVSEAFKASGEAPGDPIDEVLEFFLGRGLAATEMENGFCYSLSPVPPAWR